MLNTINIKLEETYRLMAALLALLVASPPSLAIGELDDFHLLSVSTLVHVNHVQLVKEFEGCEIGKKIEFRYTGSVVCVGDRLPVPEARRYPDVTIFMQRPRYVRGEIWFSCLMVVDDAIYTVECSEYIRRFTQMWKSWMDDPASREDLRTYSQTMLDYFSGENPNLIFR